MDSALLLALVTTSTSVLTVVGVLLLATAFGRDRRNRADLGANRLDAVFLFDGQVLIDANDRAMSLLSGLPGLDGTPVRGSAEGWDRLSRHLARPFPGLGDRLASLATEGRITLTAQDGTGLCLTAEWLGDSARLTLADGADESGSLLIDRMSWRAMDEELSLLRHISEAAPMLTWRENEQGQVIWANGAYLRTLSDHAMGGGSPGWPLPALFGPGQPGLGQRLCLRGQIPGGRESWFDVQRVADPAGLLCFAVPADEAHRAERTKREFVQTLTKTFATLPIGLAVFDRTRRLQLFNPALTGLTGLEPEFLLSRPGLEGFLNRMRDKRVLPEPRDWHTWSRRLLEVETGRDGAEFEETWALAGGQTFRVSARPHPDGALAILIEDITAETHMNRNFRAELTATRAALDMLDTAVAVFASNGQLVLTNEAFSRLWLLEGVDSLGGVTLTEAVANWRATGVNDTLWDQVIDVSRQGGVASGVLRLDDGEVLNLRAHRGAGGQLMIAFDTRDSLGDGAPDQPVRPRPVPRPVTRTEPALAAVGAGRLPTDGAAGLRGPEPVLPRVTSARILQARA